MSALDKQIGGTHYRQGGIQPVQYIEANELQYLEGSVVKRVTRHDKETGKGRQDIEKAIHELELLLELRYPRVAVAQQVMYALSGTCLLCGAADGHGGLQCPNTVAKGTV